MMTEDWLNGKKQKANQSHTCDMCNGRINMGETYDWQRCRVPGSYDWDGDWTDAHYRYLHFHNYDCITPMECQKGNHDFVYRQESGDPDDFFDEYKPEGTFCTACGMDKDDYDTEQAKFTEDKNLNR